MGSEARDKVVDYIVNETWGPVLPVSADAFKLPEPDSEGIHFIPAENSRDKIVDPATNELIIQGKEPKKLYGTGVLHKVEKSSNEPVDLTPAPQAIDEGEDDDGETPPEPKVDVVGGGRDSNVDDDDFSLEQSQKLFPSAMGLTFQIALAEGDLLKVEFSGAFYDEIKIKIGERKPAQAWKRNAIVGKFEESWSSTRFGLNRLHKLTLDGTAAEYVTVYLRLRKAGTLSDGRVVLIATLVAKNHGESEKDKDVFQSHLSFEIKGVGHLVPTQSRVSEQLEQQELDHLYRHALNFGTGHGTSAFWQETPGQPLRRIETAALPKFYQEVLDFDYLPSISMKEMAEGSHSSVIGQLTTFVDSYSKWIHEESEKSVGLAPENSAVVNALTAKALHIKNRIQDGLNLLADQEQENVFKAFQWANEAMYEQQKNGKRSTRNWLPGELFALEAKSEPSGSYGSWRPFQIAFLLAIIPGLVNKEEPTRDEVDLIFFPTGGGKTEAYLGAAAFTILYNRLTAQPEQNMGVEVLMRYTLRLLTIQQFERSSGLIAVLEQKRSANSSELGKKPISIGVWLGRDTTPNSRADGLAELRDPKYRKEDSPNPFILTKCPICAAKFGWWEQPRKGTAKSAGFWKGFSRVPNTGSKATIRFLCPDQDCVYGDVDNPLPIWITDEDVYEEQPTFILGTVDKFAQLAWKEEAKSIFNIDSNGQRIGPPPALIIQDELHLISGPLGSMVGLYEPVIEKLCTDTRGEKPVRPKIVASTATTRNFVAQVRGLYGREKVMLFPQAIDRANETYFSTVMVNKETGVKEKGSLYLGVSPATFGSAQNAAAQLAAILKQAPNMVPDEKDQSMDFYRTSVWFFNSLKELGTTMTLMLSVTRDVIGGIRLGKRFPDGVDKGTYPNKILELTSRIDSNKVSGALERLAKPSWDVKGYDTCLASSIMEVGVDVPRLGLLTIMSQPKTTSQYIQVSGRVGRARSVGPGLVVMLYNTGRARDRSVYERFQSYHQTLYAQVEPLSVTPFAIQAMNHGLNGALIALYRMTVPSNGSPDAIDWVHFDSCVEVFRERVQSLGLQDQSQLDFEHHVKSLKSYMQAYSPSKWSYPYKVEYEGFHDDTVVPALMRGRRESLKPPVVNDKSIMVMTSMRSVDGQTVIRIAKPYAELEGDE